MWYKIVISLTVAIVLKVLFGELVVKRFIDIPTPLIVAFAVVFSLAVVVFEQWRAKKAKAN